MSEKRSRKSKLVPRSLKDCDDDETSQDEHPKRTKIWNATYSDDSITTQPSTSSYQPLQFDIKVEVEEYDEFGTTETPAEIKSEMLNENDLFEVEERDINSLLAQALSTTKADFDDTSDNEIKFTSAVQLDHDYSPKKNVTECISDENKILKRKNISKKRSLKETSSALSYLQIDEDKILGALNDLYRKTNMSVAESSLAIEMRNLWGRCRFAEHNPTVAERQIQTALNSSWRKWWWKNNKSGDVPLMYKCYMCNQAWWHLGPFQEHLESHTDDYTIDVEIQKMEQYNMYAQSTSSFHIYKDIRIDTDCWRCGNGYEHHVREASNIQTPYKCEHCSLIFKNCITHKAHEAECVQRLKTLAENGSLVVCACRICSIMFLFKETLEIHYSEYHDVRSDLIMFATVRSCAACNRNYSSHLFHYCAKKTYSRICTYCAQRFPSSQALDIHLLQERFTCTACHQLLPQRCMMAEHLLKHTSKFTMLYKCLLCEDNVLLLDEKSVKKHNFLRHKEKKKNKNKNFFNMVLAPRGFIEAQKQAAFGVPLDSGPAHEREIDQEVEEVTNVVDNQKELDKAIEMITGRDGVSDSPNNIKVKVEIDSDHPTDMNDPENYIPTSLIKAEQQDFDELIVKEKMIAEMQKNHNFTEDEEGYEYILSSVFNTKGMVLENQIAEETNEFEELINKEAKKPATKKGRKRKEKSKVIFDDTQNGGVKLEMLTSPPKDNSPKILKCDYQDCNSIALNQYQLKTHKSSHRAVTVTCSKCLVSFINIRQYLYHLTEHGLVEWSCPECLRSFASYESVSSHLRNAVFRSFSRTQFIDKTRDKISVKYKCKKCKETVARPVLFDHWEKHLGVVEPIVKVEISEDVGEVDFDGIPCDPPGDRIAEDMKPDVMERVIESLVNNVKRKHENKMCLACGRCFDRRNDCKRHHIEHLLTNAYSTRVLYKGLRCQICASIFIKADGYKHHMRNHGHLPVHRCDLCLKTFSDSSNYVKHKKTHGSMYICDICNKRFQVKSSIIKHMACHSSLDPINCLFCPKKFHSESDFSRHIRSRHNQKTFKFSCVICKKKFKSVKDKWDHMWIQHKERQVKADCPVCGAEFRKVSDVKSHLRKDHNLDIPIFTTQAFNEFLMNDKAVQRNYMNTVKKFGDWLSPFTVVRDHKNDFIIYTKEDVLNILKSMP